MKQLRLLILLVCVLLPSTCLAANLSDTFTDTANTLLSSHTSDSGSTWTKEASSVTTMQITPAGRIRKTAASGDVSYYSSWTPASPDYELSVDVYIATATDYAGLIGRFGTGTIRGTGYCTFITAGNIYLYASGAIVTDVPVTYSAGQTHNVRMVMKGSNVYVYFDNVLMIKAIAASGPTTAGYAAVYIGGSVSTDSTGMHLDNFTTTDLAVDTHTITRSDLLDNGYDNVSLPRQSVGSRVFVTTNSPYLWVTGSDTYGLPDALGPLGTWSNGTATNIDVTSRFTTTPQTFFIAPATIGGTNTFEVSSGAQSFGTTGSYLESISVVTGSTLTITAPTRPNNRVLMYHDSIATGQGSTYPAMQSLAALERHTYGRSIMLEAWGSRALADDCDTSAHRLAFAQRIASYNSAVLVMPIGTNDWGGGHWHNAGHAAGFGAAYADMLDKLHAACPCMRIICVSPLYRTNEGTPDSDGEYLSNYRSQISTAVSTRTSFVTYVDGTSIIGSGHATQCGGGECLADGLHCTTAGYVRFASVLDPYINTALSMLIACPNPGTLPLGDF